MANNSENTEIRLGRLELQIMNVVWQRGQATVQDVMDRISRNRKPAYSTILTMMRKLEGKGYLEHEEAGRTYVYRATLSQREVRHGLLGDMLDRLFEGSPTLLLSSLVEQRRISGEELEEIRKAIGDFESDMGGA